MFKGCKRNSAFTLIELLVVIAIIALLIGILLPALGQAKRQGRFTQCIGRLQQIGVAYNSYAVTFQDKIVSFTWTRDVFRYSPYSDCQPTGGTFYTTDIEASRAQALDYIHRATSLNESEITAVTNWIPQIIYNHLALTEQQDWKLPSVEFTCPEDADRIRWQRNWATFRAGASQPQPANSGSNPQYNRWWVSASYNFVPASMSQDRGDGGRQTIVNATDHRTYQGFNTTASANNVIGRRKITDILSPASKVVIYDYEARHYGKRNWYCAYPEAQQPLLFADGHVKVYANGSPSLTGITLPYGPQRKGNAVNPGWNPTTPQNSIPMSYNYTTPEGWEAPLRNGTRTGTDQVIGYYRYTRGGLKGVDVEQPEVDIR